MANKPTGRTLRLALDALERALGPGASCQIEDWDPDAPPGSVPLSVRLRGGLHPNRLYLAIGGDAMKPRSYDDAVIHVLSRSPKRLVQELRNRGANLIDLDRGWVRVRTPGMIVDRTDVTLPRPGGTQRPLRNPFGDRASLVLRTLADHPTRIWGTRELAAAADVSTMTASHAVRQLEEAGVVLVETEGRAKRIYLKSIESLIDVWAAHYSWKDNPWMAFAAPIGDRQRFVHRLQQALGNNRWGLTLHAGAGLVSPVAVYNKVHVYLDVQRTEELKAIARASDWHEADDGRLVIAQPYYKESAWHGAQMLRGIPVVSDLQLVLDLWEYPDRGREQAMHLLQSKTLRSRSFAPEA